MPREALRELPLQRLTTLVRHVKARVPLYRKRLAGRAAAVFAFMTHAL